MIEHPPSHWKEQPSFIFPPDSGNIAGRVWEHMLVPIRVIRSLARMKDDYGTWIHVSVSRKDKIPSWQELTKVKDEFLGPSAEAIQVLPSKADYVNLHNFCLHIWSPHSDCKDIPNLHHIEWEDAI